MKSTHAPFTESKDLVACYLSNHKLVSFNDTCAPYSYGKTIIDFFENNVQHDENFIAVLTDSGSLTYRELNEKANQLAWSLREKGVQRDTLVGIMTERSCEMIIGIFGVLKSGGAYLPIDPAYPLERKKQIIEDSKISVLLTQSHISTQSLPLSLTVIDLNDSGAYEGNKANPVKINSPHDCAYVIYTSGSTGKPKGVMIEHHSLVNRIEWMQKEYPLVKEDVIMQKTTYTFDVSVWELLWWSMQGCTVYLLPNGKEYDPRLMAKLIEKHKISVMHFVPSVLRMFIEYLEMGVDIEKLSSLKWIFSSGEALNPATVARFNDIFKEQQALLINLYGPTEATIDVSHFPCLKGVEYQKVPIGKPISNTQFFILDEKLNLLPVGVAGELYISGVGVARAYLNNPELTFERFVDNPFAPGTRMYKTGDLAQWTEDGNVLFLGRLDNQVKVRGLRIELGEIEYHLNRYNSFSDSIVAVREDDFENQYLIAFIKLKVDLTKPKAEDVKEYLLQYIPVYMVPACFIYVNEFPLKTNGKVDRKQLLEIDFVKA